MRFINIFTMMVLAVLPFTAAKSLSAKGICSKLPVRSAAAKIPFALEQVSPACIDPQGRWQESLGVIADGWIGRAARTRHPVFYSFLWERDWSRGDFASPHYAVYLAGGYVRLARYVPDSELARLYHREWLPKVLASQMPNGYIGGGQTEGTMTLEGSDSRIPRYELLSVDLILESLLWEYEFSGDPNVLKAIIDLTNFTLAEYINPKTYNQREMETPAHQAICRSLTEVYRYTGDPNILTALTHYIQRQKAILKGTFAKKRPHIHAVCYAYMLQAPITMYHYTGDTALLEMAMEGFDHISEFALQTTGTPTGCEITLEKGCRKYSEHCAGCEWINACIRFLRSRGQVRFADIAERCMHNAYFGSKSPDGLTLTYYHTLNQLFATTWTGQYLRDFEPSDVFNGEYNMAHGPLCCNAITSKAFAQFIENAVMKTPDGEITFVFYGPCTFEGCLADGSPVRIVQQTDYPYEDRVRFTVLLKQSQDFAMRFRIPSWCSKASLKVNGRDIDESVTPGSFARVMRQWRNGDTIELAFEFPITLAWDHSPAAGKGAAVVRGPLVYALPIRGDWTYIGSQPPDSNNMKEAWNVTMTDGQRWNVALEIDTDHPGASVEPIALAVPEKRLPWQYPPVGLKVRARTLGEWTLDRISGHPCTPALPQQVQPQGESFDVTLVPFGFTQLRMTVLPIIGESAHKPIRHGEHEADI